LINTMLGQDLSIVSPLPQTTRNHFHCTMTIDRTEIVFVDTPGVHRSNKEINLRMNQEAEFSLEGADAALLLVDSNRLNEEDFDIFKEVLLSNDFSGPVWLVFTKKDLAESKVKAEQLIQFKERLQNKIPQLRPQFFWISTVNEDNINELTAALMR